MNPELITRPRGQFTSGHKRRNRVFKLDQNLRTLDG
jgi:hypothetical protein